MTPELFVGLDVYHDLSSRSAVMNMAIDEALLEAANVPSLRFYRWQHPALSFGYFCPFANVAPYQKERDLVRRWTGGGIVFHGEDLTYSIVIPRQDPAFKESSRTIYEKVHRAICDALSVAGQLAELVPVAAVRNRRIPPVPDGRHSNCFANPVRSDVLINGKMVAGAAQRRTRIGLLQQGSIQNADLSDDFADRFARGLGLDCSEATIGDPVLTRAMELVRQKYAADRWLQWR
jgi:lipoate-protein ligase A